MRTFARVAAVGVAGFTLLKLFTTVLIPLLGMLLGLLALTVKLALLAAVAYFLYTILRSPRSGAGEPSDEEMEDKIEIVVEEDEKGGA